MSLGKPTRKRPQKLSAQVEPAMPAQAFSVATASRTPIKKPTICGRKIGPSLAVQDDSKPRNVPPLEDRASALHSAAFRHRNVKSEDAYVDYASESSGSDISEEWCATSDDESDVSGYSAYTDEVVVNDDMAFINDEDLSNADHDENTRDSTADNTEPPETPASSLLNTHPNWNDRRARRRLLRKRPRIETPPPRVGPSESLPALRLRKHKRLRVESPIESPTRGTAPAVPALHISPADVSSVPQAQEPSEPPVTPKPVPVKQGNIFSNGEYTFRFSRQIRNYAIPEEEYRETGGRVVSHEQFESRDTGRCGEINVLWMLLFDPEWLANDDGWAKFRVRSPS
ncbi:hypothetical protein PENSPDRAFT_656558 [Peniophora sp. CONT]|nr:hypothetical protein PENSPDRAFT_656558 [Peniophora sp. CONT]